ncbi:sigma factor-like helix-turn-helix DNA-binding protein [Streptomyces sp. NBC_00343]|uniref:sigma-70 region 4 domain-containing protein n=1 Tax=Streptomyces sp. NBC_00343 TaxID=2975719 RepID=UPI002E2B2EA8|nr:sigma factor-like helix-turn-helix DNA-binding protein [Streptomyces sp. NBC_00343]
MFVSLRRRGEVPVRASCPQRSPGDAPRPVIELVLPLEYTAFCLLHQDHYLHYTRERVQDAWMSRQVVEAVLGNLATIWPTVISSPRPAAVAWGLLDALIASALRGRRAGASQSADAVHRLLPRAQADAVILCCRLDLSEKEAAELMGVEAPAVASQLRMAQRALPGRWTAAPAGAQP